MSVQKFWIWGQASSTTRQADVIITVRQLEVTRMAGVGRLYQRYPKALSVNQVKNI